MSLDIGKKLQCARRDAGLTQEEAAERIGVSRQTVSNWENERTYPDIVSVIRLSDVYSVSLDKLLKGEDTKMSQYYQYLSDSTNTVKSNEKKGRLILIIASLVIWAGCIILFWLGSRSDAMGYALLVFYLILPVTALVVSLIAGLRGYWGKLKWLLPIVSALIFIATDYATFLMANNLATGKINPPRLEPGTTLLGVVSSLLGLGIGALVRHIGMREKTE